MNESIEKCKYCGRDLTGLEIYEKCNCEKFINEEDPSEWIPFGEINGDD